MANLGVDSGDTAWVLVSSALVLLMTPGLAFFYGGLVQHSNVLNTMMMSFMAMGTITVIWFAVGFSLVFGEGNLLIGNFAHAALVGLEGTVWPDTHLPSLVFVTFQMTFAVIGAAIISGGIVERMRFSAYIIFTCMWSLLVYCPVAHWVWGPGGWVADMGAIDFAGGTVVHEITAVTALVLAALLGPREVVLQQTQKPEPHQIPYVMLGGGLLWFGWSGFNAGSALAAGEDAGLALVNTYLAAAFSLVTWAGLDRAVQGRSSAVGTVTGAVVGLVIITPAAGFVSPGGSATMGSLGCVLVYPCFKVLGRWLHVMDDSLDVFPCHGVAGFIGTILTGIFAKKDGFFYSGDISLLLKQAAAALATGAYAAAMSALIFLCLRLVMRVRVAEHEESQGLDGCVHGETAYHTDPRPYDGKKSTGQTNDPGSRTNVESEHAGESPGHSAPAEDSSAQL